MERRERSPENKVEAADIICEIFVLRNPQLFEKESLNYAIDFLQQNVPIDRVGEWIALPDPVFKNVWNTVMNSYLDLKE